MKPQPQPLTTRPTPVGFDVLQKALTWPDKARAVKIINADSYVAAGELLKGIKSLQKEADATFDPIIADSHRAHATAIAQKRKVSDPLDGAERIIKNAMVAYDQEQQRIERDRQREREAEAKRQADAEALERAAAIEREGAAWGDAGLIAEANQIVEEQIQAPAPPLPPAPRSVPRVAGIAPTKRWSGECRDLLTFVKHVAANPQYLNLLQINQSAVNTLARSMQAGLNTIPGLRAVETPDISARG